MPAPGPPTISLQPFLPHDETHKAELTRQRILCGWGVEDVPLWCSQVAAGDKGLFWVMQEGHGAGGVVHAERLSMREGEGPPPPSPFFQPVGTISLDFVDNKGDTSLASRPNKTMTIATFFLLKSVQGQGLGTKVMDELEQKALDAGAEWITLNTVPTVLAESARWWAELGVVYDPKSRDNQRWYERRGYVAYKTVPRYQEKNIRGETVLLDGIYMRKAISASR